MNTIDKIISEFDFQKVHDVMTELNWTWWFESTPPSIEVMKRNVLPYLNNVNYGKSWSNGSGGFTARNEDNKLILDFCLVDYEFYFYDDNKNKILQRKNKIRILKGNEPDYSSFLEWAKNEILIQLTRNFTIDSNWSKVTKVASFYNQRIDITMIIDFIDNSLKKKKNILDLGYIKLVSNFEIINNEPILNFRIAIEEKSINL